MGRAPWGGVCWGKAAGGALAGTGASGPDKASASCADSLKTACSSATIRVRISCPSAVSGAELETPVESSSAPCSLRHFMRGGVCTSSCYLLVVVVVLVLVLLL